ncbi:hypothetical protein CALVIDRAFT_361134 [Calocera viscosa TUFC12733]|uniref:Fungal-type protein kinase domain-containing protein n=1 Tax=Calocera viscosa (strain TUFC12733) TaxID=1330018 RepID=A0A167H6L9_CALVF|nr:hypothetical protein CALVIDRAFT_361134 [Calocera viscosa TUFC12733]
MMIVREYQLVPTEADGEQLSKVLLPVFRCVDNLRTRAKIALRDLSPSNIMCEELADQTLSGVLVDLDLAAQLSEPAGHVVGSTASYRSGTPLSDRIARSADKKHPDGTPFQTHFTWFDHESMFWVLVHFVGQGGLRKVLDIKEMIGSPLPARRASSSQASASTTPPFAQTASNSGRIGGCPRPCDSCVTTTWPTTSADIAITSLL